MSIGAKGVFKRDRKGVKLKRRSLTTREIKLIRKIMSDIKIVILQRGWVFIGRFSQEGQNCKLENAYCIRQWGTTKGIGELVDGPTSKTLLDPTPVVNFHEMTVVALIDCNENGWKSKC